MFLAVFPVVFASLFKFSFQKVNKYHILFNLTLDFSYLKLYISEKFFIRQEVSVMSNTALLSAAGIISYFFYFTKVRFAGLYRHVKKHVCPDEK